MKANELQQAVVSLDRISAKVEKINMLVKKTDRLNVLHFETLTDIVSLRELLLAGLDLALWEESDSIEQYEAKKAECNLFYD